MFYKIRVELHIYNQYKFSIPAVTWFVQVMFDWVTEFGKNHLTANLIGAWMGGVLKITCYLFYIPHFSKFSNMYNI